MTKDSFSTFVQGLIASGPAPEHRDALMLYDQFVGDWVADTIEYAADGATTTTQWDIRFDWVLEGRAIQDLWITPLRNKEPLSWHAPRNRYSTTMRIYDPKIDAWHIIWMNPPNGHIMRQIGRAVGSEIIQIGDIEPSGELVRWVYRDITETSFRWCQERSTDLGMTWRLAQEMHARRCAI
jgi:hypothetical protein